MMAPVGQTWTQLPHLMQVLSPSGTSVSATIMLFAPRSATESVKLPAISAQARTQRRHKIQRLLSSTKYGWDVSTTKLFHPGWMGQWVISSAYAAFCNSQSPPLTWQNGQKWLRSLKSIERMNLRDFLSASVSVSTTMPLLTGNVQD